MARVRRVALGSAHARAQSIAGWAVAGACVQATRKENLSVRHCPCHAGKGWGGTVSTWCEKGCQRTASMRARGGGLGSCIDNGLLGIDITKRSVWRAGRSEAAT
jgi:hypothetical protein